MEKSKDNDQTFVIKILDDLRSNQSKPLRMHYDTSMRFLSNDSSLISNKRQRSCSPELQDSILSMLNVQTIGIMS